MVRARHRNTVVCLPTGTGKTMSPLGLATKFRVIFVCAARHVGLSNYERASRAVCHGAQQGYFLLELGICVEAERRLVDNHSHQVPPAIRG